MSMILSTLNGAVGALFAALLYPFAGMAPIVGLTVVSALVAVLMLFVYKATSNQDAIEKTKAQISAGLFEIRLFNDDIRAILGAQGDIVKHNLRYMGLNIVPLLWMIVPIVLIIAQLQFYYGYENVEPGDSILLTVQLKEGAFTGRPDLELEVPEGLHVELGPVWAPSLGEASWRLVLDEPGDYDLTVRINGESYTKELYTGTEVDQRSPWRLEPGFINQVGFPVEAPFDPDAPVKSISVGFEDGTVSVLGWNMHWMIAFILLSIVFAFAMKGLFGVTI